jgi:hypothetical protein
LEDLNRRLVVLWVINRQRAPLELLKDFVSAMPDAFVHVVRNCYFGEERKFELFNTSKIREAIEQRGRKSLTFPDLADRVAHDLYSKRLAIVRAGLGSARGIKGTTQDSTRKRRLLGDQPGARRHAETVVD